MNKMFVSNDLNYFHNGSMRCGSSQKIGFSWRFTEHFAAVLSARRVSTQLLGVWGLTKVAVVLLNGLLW